MNKIFLIGNLTFDPETRTTPSGASVCSFNIAVNRRFAAANGEKQTDFFRISAWRGLGDNCQKYLSKGKKVAVVGELTARTYEAKDGTTRLSLEVNADEVEFLTPRGEGGAAESYSSGSAKGAPQQDLSGFEEVADDDLPF